MPPHTPLGSPQAWSQLEFDDDDSPPSAEEFIADFEMDSDDL